LISAAGLRVDPAVLIFGAVVSAALLAGFGLTVAALASPRVRDVLWPRGARPVPPRAPAAAGAVSIFLLAYLALGLAGGELLPDLGAWRWPAYAALTESMMVAAAIAAVWASRTHPADAPASLGLARPRLHHPVSGILGFLASFWVLTALAVSIFWLWSRAAGEPPPTQQVLREMPAMGAGPRLTMAAIAVLVAPLAEEMLFRGVLFAAMRARFGFWAAALASSLVFGVVHLAPAQLLPLAALGMVLAWMYERTGSLWPSVVAHTVQNAYVMAMMYSGLAGRVS